MIAPDDAAALGPHARFVRAHAAPAQVPLVPEISLYTATEVTPLWHATEAWLAARSVPPPFWAFAWSGGQALARYLLDHPEVARGKRVLDVACGGGVVAIAAAQAGASRVDAVDIDPFAVAAARANAALNGVTVTASCRDALAGADVAAYDLVTAGDVCYERPMAERLLAWLRARAGEGAEVLVGDPERAYAPSGGVVPLAQFEVPTPLDLEGQASRRTHVFRVLAGAR